MRLLLADATRVAGRRRFWLVFTGVLVLSMVRVYRLRDGFGGAVSWREVLQYAIQPVQAILPLIVGATVGTSVAEDRKSGFVSLLMVRGVSRSRYVMTRLAAGTGAIALALGSTLLVVGAFARAIGPAVGSSAGVAPAPSAGSDLGFIVATSAVMVLGGAFYVGLGVASGLLTTNAFLVVALSFAVHVVPTVILPASLDALRPVEALHVPAAGASLFALSGSWLTGILAAMVGSAVIARTREAL